MLKIFFSFQILAVFHVNGDKLFEEIPRNCIDDGSCGSGNYVTIPPNINQTIKELILSHNNIKKLENSPFGKFSELETLDLKNNQINYIDVDVFKSLDKLKKIDLMYNNLTKVHLNFPDSLNTLLLNGNAITTFTNSSLRRNNIIELDLNGNKLSKIEKLVFENYPYLTTLDLSENRITSIEKEAFQNLENLQVLVVSQNKLSTFEQSIHQLTTLNLDENSLTKFPKVYNSFLLESLDLSYSNLSIDDIYPLCSLTKIELKKEYGFSPDKCQCAYLQGIFKHITDRKIEVENSVCQWASGKKQEECPIKYIISDEARELRQKCLNVTNSLNAPSSSLTITLTLVRRPPPERKDATTVVPVFKSTVHYIENVRSNQIRVNLSYSVMLATSFMLVTVLWSNL